MEIWNMEWKYEMEIWPASTRGDGESRILSQYSRSSVQQAGPKRLCHVVAHSIEGGVQLYPC
jgi:hypothetical protein